MTNDAFTNDAPNAPDATSRRRSTPGTGVAALPPARGPVTRALFNAWTHAEPVDASSFVVDAPLSPLDGDRQLALYCLYELSYGGFRDVPLDRERDPGSMALLRRLEDRFEAWLSQHVEVPSGDPIQAVQALVDQAPPGPAGQLAARPSAAALRRLLVLRSAYHLKEADPHTRLIPRLRGPERHTIATIQSGEYGVGHRFTHADLYAASMRAMGLDATPNAYLHAIPAPWLAMPNLLSLYGSNAVWAQRSVGQLALLEMDSVAPNGELVGVVDALGLPADVRTFFHIHTLADTEHGALMEEVLVQGDTRDAAERVFGAAALQHVLSVQAGAFAAELNPAPVPAASPVAG